jgi:hypothetical protein
MERWNGKQLIRKAAKSALTFTTFSSKALALKFRILSIQFTSERLRMADVGVDHTRSPEHSRRNVLEAPTRRCVGSTGHISIRACPRSLKYGASMSAPQRCSPTFRLTLVTRSRTPAAIS